MKTNKSPSQSRFEKVEPGLFRYKSSGVFYTVLKKDGKTKWKNLKTTDKSTARRMLAQDRNEQKEIDSNLSGLELKTLTDMYLASIANLSKKTRTNRSAIIKLMLERFPAATKVRDIKSSDMGAWIASIPFEPGTQNEYARVTKDIFKIAVADRVILRSPAADLKRRKVPDPVRLTPSEEQFKAIVADIRGQVFNADRNASGDFIEFMGLAGLGQAELKYLTWSNVDFAGNRMSVRRRKTGVLFPVIIYPQLKPLLERLHAERGKSEAVFKIADGKKALSGACKRLGYPPFTQRALRRVFISKAIEKGIDFKAIAKMQGHKDGGFLVAKTYGHLREEHLEAMAAKMV